MRSAIVSTFFILGAVQGLAAAQPQPPAVTQLAVQAGSSVPDLVCDKAPAPIRAPSVPNPDPMEIPTEEMVETIVPLTTPPAPPGIAPPSAQAIRAQDGYRIAIWGDSHLAANFFTEALAKLLALPVDTPMNALLPANMGKAGVRLPLRQSCVSPEWKYEPGYIGTDKGATPGPGMVNMVADEPGATLAWDLRRDAQAAGYERVRILYQQTEAPLRIALSVDGAPEQEVLLHAQAGPAALELVAAQPLSQVRLRLLDGRLRFQGLDLASPRSNPFVLDVFGYPGATVNSWKTANLDYLGAWFAQRDYQLVMLEFGTNEGNVKPFDLASYRKTLTEAVRNMQTRFPAAACILIAPGDRGVLVLHSANLRRAAGKAKARRKTVARPVIDLLQYARIHADIGRVQAEVATAAGCSAWSMQTAMGGPGSAYAWAQQSPPLMARDLIHFTVAGYRRLAQQFVRDMGWH